MHNTTCVRPEPTVLYELCQRQLETRMVVLDSQLEWHTKRLTVAVASTRTSDEPCLRTQTPVAAD